MEVKFLPVPFLRTNRIFSAEVLLKAAQDKHSRHYKQFDQHLAQVVQKLDSAIHGINHYPADSVIDFHNTYPLDSDLSGG